MNCHKIQSEIAQTAGDSLTTEIVAHTQECAACRQTLKETLSQQKWLRERFAEVSADLIAHAPPFSELDLREYSGPARPAPLLPFAWAAALLVAALLGWWTWANSSTRIAESSFAEGRAPRESGERPGGKGNNLGASSDPSAPLSELKSIGPTPGSSWLADMGPVPTSPEEHSLSQPSSELSGSSHSPESAVSRPAAEPAASSPLPEVAAAAATLPTNSSLATGVFKMQPTALAPTASGYLAAIIPNDTAEQTPAMVALSVSGLPAESNFYVRTRDGGWNAVWLGSGRTDTRGSAVVVMLNGSPTTAGQPLTVPAADTEPTVTLNFGGATGEDVVVVDAAGYVLLTVSTPTIPPDP